ncbi:MAG: sulfite exporter TauE/SafE family protein [Anaerolineales bacterium]
MFFLYFSVPLIAFLYASVGFGGATGYLAVMSLFRIPPQVMASTALFLNILVSTISFVNFYRAGHLRRDLLLPFLLPSIPAAFLGGYWKITERLYFALLYAVLTLVAIRLLLFTRKSDEDRPLRPIAPSAALLIGAGIGLLSGMVGIGGGILLSPIILFARWGNARQASAVSAAFILLNSISGLIGRISGGTFALTPLSLSLIPLALFGALAGSYWGAARFQGTSLRRILGAVMGFAALNFWWKFF